MSPTTHPVNSSRLNCFQIPFQPERQKKNANRKFGGKRGEERKTLGEKMEASVSLNFPWWTPSVCCAPCGGVDWWSLTLAHPWWPPHQGSEHSVPQLFLQLTHTTAFIIATVHPSSLYPYSSCQHLPPPRYHYELHFSTQPPFVRALAPTLTLAIYHTPFPVLSTLMSLQECTSTPLVINPLLSLPKW